jgi:hypothetical protein
LGVDHTQNNHHLMLWKKKIELKHQDPCCTFTFLFHLVHYLTKCKFGDKLKTSMNTIIISIIDKYLWLTKKKAR